MPDRDNYWAVIHNGKWAVKREGNDQFVSTHDNQDEAWNEAKRLAEQSRGEAYLQDSNGSIRERNTYGHDPRSIPG